MRTEALAVSGDLTMFGCCDAPENAVIELDQFGSLTWIEGKARMKEAPPWLRKDVQRRGHLFVVEEPNGFVNNGLNVALNLLFNVGANSAIQSMIVANSTTAVAATDTSIEGGATNVVFAFGATQNAYSAALATPAPAATANQTMTAGIQFTQANYANAGVWPINRIGFVNVAASTQLGLIDVIGNTAAQADPYSRVFSIDLHSAGTWTLNPQITITAIKQQSAFPTPL